MHMQEFAGRLFEGLSDEEWGVLEDLVGRYGTVSLQATQGGLHRELRCSYGTRIAGTNQGNSMSFPAI